MIRRIAIVVAAVLLGSATVHAQDRPLDPKACAPGERLQPTERGPAAPGGSATTGENLSDKLARTDGVICPPNVDPEIKAPTPDVGKMPVIPPPGTPGGDPGVRPK